MWKIAICDDESYVHSEIKKCLQLCESEKNRDFVDDEDVDLIIKKLETKLTF